MDPNEVDFRRIPADAGVSIELDSAATEVLFDKLNGLYEIQSQGVPRGRQDYVVAKTDEVIKIDDKSKNAIIRQLLEQGYSEDVWEKLAETDPGLATRLAAGQLQIDREQVVAEFRQAIIDHPDEEGHWQRFFERHPWILQREIVKTCG